MSPTPDTATCPYRLTADRPPARQESRNRLRMDAIGQCGPAPRCILKRPQHWPESATGLRWIASGGSITVFGDCSQACPVATP